MLAWSALSQGLWGAPAPEPQLAPAPHPPARAQVEDECLQSAGNHLFEGNGCPQELLVQRAHLDEMAGHYERQNPENQLRAAGENQAYQHYFTPQGFYKFEVLTGVLHEKTPLCIVQHSSKAIPAGYVRIGNIIHHPPSGTPQAQTFGATVTVILMKWMVSVKRKVVLCSIFTCYFSFQLFYKYVLQIE